MPLSITTADANLPKRSGNALAKAAPSAITPTPKVTSARITIHASTAPTAASELM
jgi:hypothetical protein